LKVPAGEQGKRMPRNPPQSQERISAVAPDDSIESLPHWFALDCPDTAWVRLLKEKFLYPIVAI
jgi:hypothetical protein